MLQEFFRYLGQKIVKTCSEVGISKNSRLTVEDFDMSLISSNAELEVLNCLKLTKWHAMNTRKK